MIAALLDHLWQSTLFAGGAGLLALMLRNNRARLRHRLWLAASLKFLVPFSLLVRLGGMLAPPTPPFAVSAAHLALMRQAALPFAAATLPAPAPSFNPLSVLFAGWLAGFLILFTVWGARWLRVRIALGRASPLPIAAPIAIKATAAPLGPGLFGIWRPVLLLPQSMASQLSPKEMRAILDHELCHLERRDNLTASLHMLVESLFWFYPLVWWLGARLTAERERACDECVVEEGNDPSTYADGILKVCRFYAAPLPLASSVLGADLEPRLKHIMAARLPVELGMGRKALLAAGAATALAWPLVTGWANAVALEFARPPPRAVKAMAAIETIISQNEVTTSQAGCERSFVNMLADVEKTYGSLSPVYPQQKRNDSDPLPMSIEWKNSRGASRYQLTTVFLSDETAHVWNARKPLGALYLDAAAVWSAGGSDKKAVCLTQLDYRSKDA